jgi:hypothetical protein
LIRCAVETKRFDILGKEQRGDLEQVAQLQRTRIGANRSVGVQTCSRVVQPEKSDIFRFHGPELSTNSGAEMAEFQALGERLCKGTRAAHQKYRNDSLLLSN